MKSFAMVAAVFALASAAQVSAGQSGVAPAEQLFRRYVALADKFDPALSDLYSDEALIKNMRRYPDGSKRVIEIPAPRYKEMIRAAMPLARARGDGNRYSKVKYVREGENVRITAMRYSLMKKYSSPLSLLVGADSRGEWRILEEGTESIP